MLTESEELSDDRLLHDYVFSQSHEAFAALVRRHGPMVWGVCRRIARHTHDAEDAFQATFAVLVRQARSIRRKRAIGAWLHQVAHRTALRTRTASTRQERTVNSLVVDVPARPVPDDASREHSEILDEEIGRLPEFMRLPVIMCYLQGLDKPGSGRTAQLPRRHDRLASGAHARDRLRQRLVRRGLVLGSAAAVTTLLTQAGSAAPLLPSLSQAALNCSFVAASKGATTGAIVSASSVRLANEMLRLLARRRLLMRLGLLLGAACTIGAYLGIHLFARHVRQGVTAEISGRQAAGRREFRDSVAGWRLGRRGPRICRRSESG